MDSFEWDEAKRAAALKKHGIDFLDATRIFAGPVLRARSAFEDEDRWIAVGLLDELEIAVIYTLREGTVGSSPRGGHGPMSEGAITRISLDEALKAKGQGKTDWKRLALEEEAGEDEGFDWATAEPVLPQPRKAVSLRLDPEVLEFFRQGGKGYQTRINAVLRSYVAAKRTGS